MAAMPAYSRGRHETVDHITTMLARLLCSHAISTNPPFPCVDVGAIALDGEAVHSCLKEEHAPDCGVSWPVHSVVATPMAATSLVGTSPVLWVMG